MEILEAVKTRHSVRKYTLKKIPDDIKERMKAEIEKCNEEGKLHIQLVCDDERTFEGMMAHYGKFDNVRNYIALIGKKSENVDERLGYYGERLALLAQTLGLNTCFVAMTFSKGKAKKKCVIEKGEKLVCVLALGYGETQGTAHKVKSIDEVCKDEDLPEWYKKGIECALLAPTAVNQQKFEFSREGNIVSARSLGGFYSKVDLGIVKYHFEIGAGKENFLWKECDRA